MGNEKLYTHRLPFDEVDLISYLELAMEELEFNPNGAGDKLDLTDEEIVNLTNNLNSYLDYDEYEIRNGDDA